MPRYIDADKLKQHYAWWEGGTAEMTLAEAKRNFDVIVDVQPTVEGQKHGHWDRKIIEEEYSRDGVPHVYIRCSNCRIKYHFITVNNVVFEYCPHCGAKMDGGEKDAD